MEKDILRKVQLAQLEIAQEIKRVCEENDIPYFLCDGSLLGAIRHQGFIPWDDDMDIGMLRRDYERFCSIAPEKLKQEYCLQTWYTDPNYGLPFAKIRKRNTLYLEAKSSLLQENGFFVDIFPFDFVPEDPQERAALANKLLQIYRVKLMKSRYTPWMENDKIIWKKRIGYLYYQFKAIFANQDALARAFDALATSVAGSSTVCEQCAASVPMCYPYDVCSELEDCVFEGERFRGLRQYDAFLSGTYGDYMQLPPEDQRENRHQIVQLNFGDEPSGM